MKKNIWIINQYAVTQEMPGGTRHYDFGKELTKRGYDVTISASSFHYNLHRELKLTESEKWRVEYIDGIRFLWIRSFPYQRNDWRRVVNMVSFMWRSYWIGRDMMKHEHFQKPDIIIGSTVHLLAVLSSYLLAKYYRATFLVEIRDLWPQTLIDMGILKEEDLITNILRLLEMFLYKRARKIIILSPKSKGYLISRGIDKRKISLIPNGVDILRNNLIIPKKVNTGVFKVIYAGSIGIANHLNKVLQAADIIQKNTPFPIHFILVGEGGEKDNLIKQVKKLNLTNVELRKPVSKINLPFLLQEADILLLADYNVLYGSSNKLFDYMASGKPIVFATSARHNRVYAAGCGIVVLPQDSAALAQAILILYRMSPSERRAMGEKGRWYVQKYHSIPLLVNKLEKVMI